MFSQVFACPRGWGRAGWLPSMHHRSHDLGSASRGEISNGGLPPGGSASGGSGSRWCLRPGCLLRGEGGAASSGVCVQGGLHRGGICLHGICIKGRFAFRGRWVGQTPSPKIHGILQDTVNKQAVRIYILCFAVGSCLYLSSRLLQ